jgi:GT2 family glycosyltransferase
VAPARESTCAVVLTYDRRELLANCLDALARQT